jgi:ribosomal RNA assembly protein
MKEVRIPEDRVGAVIGEGGETKEEIQDLTECEITIEDNVVRIEGDPLPEMTCQKVIKAIGRGFNPDKALKIAEKDVTFYMIDISRKVDNKSRQKELKGRVIGRDGETRRHIEKEANIDLSVYGTTIGFVGKMSNIEIAQEAINMLLNGASHSTAYTYLEKNQDKIKR